MQVRLHSFFFFVSAFFSVFIFWFGAEDESKAANAIAVTPEAKMRATIVFFIAFYLVRKSYNSFCACKLFFYEWRKKICSQFNFPYSSALFLAAATSRWATIRLISANLIAGIKTVVYTKDFGSMNKKQVIWVMRLIMKYRIRQYFLLFGLLVFLSCKNPDKKIEPKVLAPSEQNH